MNYRSASTTMLFVAGLLLLPAGPAAAQAVAPAAAPAPAGVVKRLAGTVSLERAGTRSAAAVGATVLPGDTLRTGADGAVGITLADDTLLTLGADSELVLDSFSFDSTTHDGGLLVSLWRGTVGVVTGLIGRKAPEKLRFQTRTVVLGVRGTEFIVDASGVAR
ncbi:MAG TPA: FecR family protein [Aquabacterium sp.]|nr:FecR family protein [Aquabacterium sp.]HQC95687.1 FecR family protein [Aquabacterium sp.]